VPGKVVDREIAFPEHLISGIAQHLSTASVDAGADAGMVGVGVLNSNAHALRDKSWSRRNLGAPDVHDDHRAVRADAQLRAMALTDAGPLDEAEHVGQPVDGFTYVGVYEDRHDGYGWDCAIALHGVELDRNVMLGM
jgi:hypothetical protein